MEDIYEYIVSMRDTDATGFVFHPRYGEIFTTARESFVKKLGFAYSDLVEKYELFFVVHNIKIRFVQPAKIGQVLFIHSSVLKLNELKIVVQQEIYSDKKLVNKICNQEITLVGMDCKKLELRRLPPNLLLSINK